MASKASLDRFIAAERIHKTNLELEQQGIINRQERLDFMQVNMVLHDNEWWSIGVETGKWHKFVNNEWIIETPPFVI